MSPSAPRRAIVLVDHGSRREEANAMLDDVARLIAEADPSWHVEPAHMEIAEPTLGQAFDACVAAGARDVVVCPYMLSPGRHATEDLPRLTSEAAARHPGVRARVSDCLGVDEGIARVVLRRAAQELPACGGTFEEDP